MPIEFDGPNSKVSANAIEAQSGSTITIQSGHNLSGGGSGLTALNATELTSGTLPDARLPATLPAKSGVNLTALNATQLTSGTIPIPRIADDAVTDAKIAAVAATKLTGSIADARVPLSAVTQHVTQTDLTSVHQAIATLGLHVSVADNKTAYNLPNAFIDTFEDDTGITTETTVDRSTSGEYVSTIQSTAIDSNYKLVLLSNTSNGSTTFTDSSANAHTITRTNAVHSTAQSKIGSSSIYFNNNGKLLLPDHADFNFGTSDVTIELWMHSSDTGDPANRMIGAGSHPTEWFIRSDSTQGEAVKAYISSGVRNLNQSPQAWATGAWNHVAVVRQGSTLRLYTNGVQQDTVSCGTGSWDTSSGQRVALGVGNNAGGSEFYTGYLDSVRVSKTCRYPDGTSFTPYTTDFVTANATGTLISDAQTAPSATTEVSGVILYKNNAGTATLGTDLKIYFTANNGTNWTEASSYGTAQTFSGTIQQVKLGKTTVTSGTQVALKAVWANQASGSKDTQLHGWAVNY